MPRRVKKRRQIQTDDGVKDKCVRNMCISFNYGFFLRYLQSDAGWEEYYDYIFPSDEASQSNLKLLEMAKRWKKQTVEEPSTSGEGEKSADALMESADDEESMVETSVAGSSNKEKTREGDSDTDISDSGDSESDGE